MLPVSLLFGIYGHHWDVPETVGHTEENRFLSHLALKFLAMDVMKYDPITIASDSDLAEATHIMVRNRISGIPVIDSENILVGIITKTYCKEVGLG